ncbi:hypothetical protein SAMN05216574_11258 [Blastococcus tunisiensis]|uniref:Uncharacterized protein n=1 Tax=Blastococcus tunisiensis TaxID=1798228 RepID=A0A1I2I198_9ACTN|nr:hypothetical protein SAMN05216574_11258 [Blastococcus sp. DSM 46838]
MAQGTPELAACHVIGRRAVVLATRRGVAAPKG